MSKKQKATDPARFEGNGISYRAKVIGIEDVEEARGDQLCQETILKLKEQVKASGQHKQRIFVNVTLEGLRIVDATNMELLHTHPVHQISFISRDVTDSRAFGYIYSAGDGTHKFFGIKTANAAENLVLCLRDLFQTVYDMKKQEIEEAKAKAAAGTDSQAEGDTADEQQATNNNQTTEGQESIYQVPKSNAPVNPQEQNLVDLEDQAETILKGIEQIKNLEFDDLTLSEAPRQPPTSPSISAAPPAANMAAQNDPWGLSAPTATSPSSLSGLQQLSSPPAPSSPFGAMPAFPGTPAPSVGITAPGFGMVQPGTMPYAVSGQQMMVGAPYGAAYCQQPGFGAPFTGAVRSPVPGQPGFAGASSAFNPFGMTSPAAGAGVRMMAPGAQAPGGAGADPFQTAEDNLLQPIKPGAKEEQSSQASPKSPTRGVLFGDLVDIKKSAGSDTSTKTPKEMFKELTQPPKKSLNEIKGQGTAASQSTKGTS